MTSEEWLIVAVAFLAGAAAAALVLKIRASREVKARTLVPHRTRQVVGALQSGAVVVRRDRRAAYSNTSSAALGIARPDGKLHSGVADLAEVAWATQSPVEREIEVSRGVLGVTSVVHVRVTPLDDELALAVANDNTEARAAEASRREFAVNVSHELKTPVGALSLLAESIETGADDPETVRTFARKIRKESRRLAKLIQEIIQISRLQGGESVVDYEPVEVASVVSEAVESVRLTADAKGIQIETVSNATPATLGDHDLLVMAVRNLIDNAVTYSDPGKRVTVTVAEAEAGASISVIDQGIGIDTKDADRIFERFYRGDPARSRETGGTGLGLSIVKHVTAQHGGSIKLWSQPGVGSSFTLTLPIHRETS